MTLTIDELKDIMIRINQFVDKGITDYPIPFRMVMNDIGIHDERATENFLKIIGLNPTKVADLFNLTIPSNYERISDNEMDEILSYGADYLTSF